MTGPADGASTPAAGANASLAERARAGDRRALARLLSEVENRTAVAEAALRTLYPLAGGAHLVGVTGAPGSGKSTLVAALVAEARSAGRPVAVLAIDPSSPITGGAILGDRVRMQAHAGDNDVFIRSMASRGHAGGLAGSTVAAAAVLDAAGFGLILIETVGTGQSEVEVAAIADTTLVVQAPEMGDEVQAIKAGLLEGRDVVVGDDAAGRHEDVTQAVLAQSVADARQQRHVRAGQDRQPDHVDVFLQRRRDDHRRRLAQAGVDDFEALVAQSAGKHLGTPIVAVEAGLGDEHLDRTVSHGQMIGRGGACRPV